MSDIKMAKISMDDVIFEHFESEVADSLNLVKMSFKDYNQGAEINVIGFNYDENNDNFMLVIKKVGFDELNPHTGEVHYLNPIGELVKKLIVEKNEIVEIVDYELTVQEISINNKGRLENMNPGDKGFFPRLYWNCNYQQFNRNYFYEYNLCQQDYLCHSACIVIDLPCWATATLYAAASCVAKK